MENYPYLFCWNLDKYPYLIPAVMSIQKNIMLKDDCEDALTVWNEFIYVLDGKAQISLEDILPSNNFCKIAQQGDLFFFPNRSKYTIHVTSDTFKFLHIKMLFYTSVRQHQGSSLNYSQILSDPVQNISLGIRMPRQITIQEKSEPYFLLQKILSDTKNTMPGHNIMLQCHLTELLIELMQQSANGYNNILENLDLIGISSKYSPNTILPQGCELVISDAKIWSNNPNIQRKSAKLLSVFNSSKYYDLKVQQDSLKIDITNSDNLKFCKSYIKLTALENTPYHIWIFATDTLTNDIREHRKTAYLQFFARSNMNISIGIVLYNNKNNECISHNFTITANEGMKEFCVPILGEAEDNHFSSYVHKTIEYIEQNYSSKIKLEEIAELVHLNPSYLSKIFSRETGSTISQYITNHRLSIAKKLLRMSDLHIDEIAAKTGFYDTSHFTRVFSASIGITPNVYRQSKPE